MKLVLRKSLYENNLEFFHIWKFFYNLDNWWALWLNIKFLIHTFFLWALLKYCSSIVLLIFFITTITSTTQLPSTFLTLDVWSFLYQVILHFSADSNWEHYSILTLNRVYENPFRLRTQCHRSGPSHFRCQSQVVGPWVTHNLCPTWLQIRSSLDPPSQV